MTRLMKTALSMILVVIMLVSALPFTAAAKTTMTITVATKSVTAGSSVDLDVTVKNNPGVAAIALDIDYDKNNLTLTGFTYNTEALAGASTTPYNASAAVPRLFMVNGTQNVTGDFTFATLSFKVKDNAKNGTSAYVKLSYDAENIYDISEHNIACTIENGAVNIIACVPGDINGDEKVNAKDVSRLMQYHAGWPVEVNEPALDTNGDNKLNSKDVSRLMQYLAGWPVDLYPLPPVPVNLTAVPAVMPACETEGNIAYWKDEETGKYFKDDKGLIEITLEDTIIPAAGHSPVIDPAVPADYDHTGFTEGSHCSVCEKVLKAQEITPKLEKDQYIITYKIYGSDEYLKQRYLNGEVFDIYGNAIVSQEDIYSTQDGKVLPVLEVNGYDFLGWYEIGRDTPVTSIAKGSTGNKVYYAKWKETEYSINFDCPDVVYEPQKESYTVSTGAPLLSPKLSGYTFIGWSNDDGFLVSRIMPGSTGNITLHANWTSDRNKAVAYQNYSAPQIIEDDNNGQFLFVYNIGRIENVPLDQIKYFGKSDGITIDNEYRVENKIERTNAEKIADIVSNTTTRSSGWTLSEEWNKIYQAGSQVDETMGKSSVRTDSVGNTVGGNYFVSNSKGGSSYLSTDSGGSWSNSARVTTENSMGINKSYDKSKEKYCDVQLGLNLSHQSEAGISFPIDIFNISGKVKNTATFNAGLQNGRRDKESYHEDSSFSSYLGTDRQSNESGYYNVSANESSNWNSTESYSNSYQQSRNTEVTNAINEQITKSTSYSLTDSLSGAHSEHVEVGGTEGRQNEYSTTLQFSEGDSTSNTQHVKQSSDGNGYYRLVNAGTVHVFAVVGYDVATNSYFTYNYSVLDDERHPYLDFSKDNSLFDDCQNGIVPFEVPFEVTEYVTALTFKSNGLEIGTDGSVNGYYGNEEDATVIIPQYSSASNGADETFSAIKITTLNSATFKVRQGNGTLVPNTKIKRVVLPVYITEIPDGAFAGCTNLEEVIALGVTKIGNNAFKGCTSLKTFRIDNKVTSLGSNAFEGVPEIKIQAANPSVFENALASGAKRITVNISSIKEPMDNKKITIRENTEYFALLSNGSTYNNMNIESEAAETYISNIVFANNSDTPLDLSSSKVTLNRVTVDNAPGFAMILHNDFTNISLYDTINLSSASNKAILSKSFSLRKENAGITSILSTTGDVFVYGTVTNDYLLKVTDNNNNSYETITESEYNQYLSSVTIVFNANGGAALSVPTKTVSYGQTYGQLPTPSYDYHTFVGWYTSVDGGELVTAESTFTGNSDVTLFAHWTDNPTSDWVLESEVPEGANIVSERWTYDYTDYKTSSTNSPPTGYEMYWKEDKGWNAYGSWSSWSTTKATKSDSRDVQTKTQYFYDRYRGTSGNLVATGPWEGTWSGIYCGTYQKKDWSDTKLDVWSTQTAGGTTFDIYGQKGDSWYNQKTRTMYRYRDRTKNYLYHFRKTESRESDTVITASENISNVVYWVKYIAK